MLTPDQITRLASAANALRPDWAVADVRAYLASRHAHRGYQDVAVALAVAAVDPTATSPARLADEGPWWAATRAVAGWQGQDAGPGPGRGVRVCHQYGHEREPASACKWCRSEDLAGHDHEEPAPLTSARRPRPAAVRRTA